MPRVSEYVPEIVAYIGAIVEKGLAYERNDSVYFDTRAFECVAAAPSCGWPRFSLSAWDTAMLQQSFTHEQHQSL